LIDLHTHTQASDGRLSPRDLVQQAWLAGIRVIGITDHDTIGGLEAGRAAGGEFGVRVVDGVEVTAIENERDVHVLGYFMDVSDARLMAFLADQRQARITRIREIGERLAQLGAPVDVETLLSGRDGGEYAIGRPALAAALVTAGHVRNKTEAFDRFLGSDGAAFVPRRGPSVIDAIAALHSARGLAVLAHPAISRCDQRIHEWAAAGLDGIEVYHSEHDAEVSARYLAVAESLNLAVTGGSDYHGDDRAERTRLGHVTTSQADFDRLLERVQRSS
jgi:3',5'-nucleoside bisphosphate phosphatase